MTTVDPLDAPEPSLPRPGRWWRRLLLCATLLLAILLLADIYLAHNREVLVVNGFDQPLTLRVPGQPPIAVGPAGRGLLTMAEGSHDVEVDGPITETIQIEVRPSRRQRWLGGADQLLNPGGAALLVLERLSVGPNGLSREAQWLFGERIVDLTPVDFLFADFPNLAKPEPNKPLVRLDIARDGADALAETLVSRGETQKALRLLEWGLRLRPEDVSLLTPYVGLCMAGGGAERARDFLRWGTTIQPPRVQWHRLYQDMAMHTGEHKAVTTLYEQLLGQQPTNAALTYLRGRLCARRHEALPYYERALQLDPSFAFAHNALAFVYAATADWATALRHATLAVELDPEDRQMQDLLFDAQLAAGSLETMEQDWRRRAELAPAELLPHSRLATILAVAGRTNDLDHLVRDYVQRVESGYGPGSRPAQFQLRYQAHYLKAHFAGMLDLLREQPSAFNPYEAFQGLLASGHLEAIEKSLPRQAARHLDPFHLLLLALAWEEAEQPDRAAPWREAALELLRTERPEYALSADMLAHPDQTALTDVLDLAIAPQPKAILLAALARQHPTQAEPMRVVARRLNVRREFPYHWINRLTEPAGG